MVVIEDIGAGAGAVSATVRVNGRKFPLRIAGAGLSARAAPEGFLLLALPAAMRLGVPLNIGHPIDARLSRHLPAIQALYRQWDTGLEAVEVLTPGTLAAGGPAPGEALFFTGGVDSFHAALETPGAALVFVHGLDVSLRQVSLRRRVSKRLRSAAESLGRPFLELETDLRGFSDTYFPWQLAFGGALAACAHMLAGQFGQFAIAASYGLRDEQTVGRALPDGSHPSLVPLFSSERVRFHAAGLSMRRIDKLDALANSEPARHALRVCWENRGGAYNCGVCEKCLRTMAALKALGRLGEFDCFERPLSYRRLARMAPRHPSAEVFGRENLETARQRARDPALVASLEAAIDPRRGRLWKWYGKWVPRRFEDWVYRVSGWLRPVRGGRAAP